MSFMKSVIKKKYYIFICLLIIYFTQIPSQIYAESDSDKTLLEYSSLLYGNIGIGYYKCEIYFNSTTFDSEFLLKKYNLRSNFWLITLGLDIFSDKFSIPLDYDNSSKYHAEGDKTAQQFKFISGLKLGDYTLNFNIKHRQFKFNDKINVGTAYIYSQDGTTLLVTPGSSFYWQTIYTEYELRLSENDTEFISFDYGLRYTSYNTYNEMSIGDFDYTMYTNNRFIDFLISCRNYRWFSPNFYANFNACLTLGLYYPNNTFVHFNYSDAFNGKMHGFCGSMPLQFAITYMIDHVKISIGGEFEAKMYILYAKDKKMNKDIVSYTGTYVHAGDKENIDLLNRDIFYGAYISISAYL